MKPVNDLQAVAKLFRHSPKKEDFHLKMHLNTFLTPISLSMSLLVTFNGIIKSITTSMRERGLTCIDVARSIAPQVFLQLLAAHHVSLSSSVNTALNCSAQVCRDDKLK